MSSGDSHYGDIHRYEMPRESTAAAFAIVVLAILEILLVGLFTYGIVAGWAGENLYLGNMFLGGVLAVIFIDLAFIMMLYRKEFLPDVMIVKKRRRKWEDLYIREEEVDGVSQSGDGPWDSIKHAVYPYYKK